MTDADDDDDFDKFCEEAERARTDKSTDPNHPMFDAGHATIRYAHIDKFDDDPELEDE